MDDLKASRLAEAIQDSGIIFQVVTVLVKKPGMMISINTST